MSPDDFKRLKKKDWLFDWHLEAKKDNRKVFKLVIEGNEDVIQGLVSLSIERDHIYMYLIESVKFNKGKNKVYMGVPGNLVAFACHYSIENGFEGFLAFDAKTVLVKHYEESLYAKHIGRCRMIIDNLAAERLISQYFKR